MDEPISRRPGPAAVLACILLLSLYGVLAWLAARGQSATADEPFHTVAAYHSRFDGDYRYDFDNPPLWQMLVMLPHHRSELRLDPAPPVDPARDAYSIASRLLYQTSGNDGGEFVNRSRIAMLGVALLLGAALAIWSWQLGGTVAAVVATFLFSLDPNFLAHGPLVKNDVTMSLAFFLLAWTTWNVGRSARWWNVVLLLPLCGVAMTVKLSGTLAVAMLMLLLVGRALLPHPWPVLGKILNSRPARLATAGGLFAASLILAWGMLWAFYRFRFEPGPAPGMNLDTVMNDSMHIIDIGIALQEVGISFCCVFIRYFFAKQFLINLPLVLNDPCAHP